jgi:hypothetical protein
MAVPLVVATVVLSISTVAPAAVLALSTGAGVTLDPPDPLVTVAGRRKMVILIPSSAASPTSEYCPSVNPTSLIGLSSAGAISIRSTSVSAAVIVPVIEHV